MRPIPAFVTIVTALGAAVSLAFVWTGGPSGRLGAFAFATMLLPAAAAYVMRIAASEAPRIDWTRLPAGYAPIALLLIPTVMHAAMLPAMRAVAGRLPWSGHPAWPAIALNAVAGLLVVSALAIFEEIGWRGWLLPRFMDRHNVPAAILLTSAIWAAWHVPFVLSGILAAGGVSTASMLLIVPLGVMGAGLVIGWLWVRTKSIWIVALAHGAMNNWGQYAFKYMDAGPSVDLAPVLLAGSAVLVFTGAALVWSLTWTLR
jgi:membrane protease YdiL (CAAX protease family)